MVKFLAFYLPQFHPIPENDAAWGLGFTEWTNVRKALPLFPNHHQPIEPGALGYYDLRDPEVRNQQAEIARNHGVHGFAYWHYWFAGKRVLESPFNKVLASGKPNFPFCLSWANESWTGIWHGSPDKIILQQTYPGASDYEDHFNSVLPAFLDQRYIRRGGKPIFLIYAPHKIPDPELMVRIWSKLALQNGLPGIFFIAIRRYRERHVPGAFDAVVSLFPKLADRTLRHKIEDRLSRFNLLIPGSTFLRDGPTIHHYDIGTKCFIRHLKQHPSVYPCIFTGWDNTPRSGRQGVVYLDVNVKDFRRQIDAAKNSVNLRAPDDQLIFVRSWNEWAEGNILEPDARNGSAFLEAIRESIRGESV